MSPPTPHQVPARTTAATTRPETRTPDEKLNETRFCARRAASRCRSMLSSTRRPVRSSIAYARMVSAPTTVSEIAPSTSPTRSRTRP